MMLAEQDRKLLRAIRAAQERHYVFGNPDNAYVSCEEIEEEAGNTVQSVWLGLQDLYDKWLIDRTRWGRSHKYRVNWRGLHEIGYQNAS